jgi:4-diphosphocytidyl-2-C-methyl-D-erythritol kinase
MVTFPFCKINLGLHILNKRSDGYHDIATCFYPVPWTDILEIIPSNKVAFTCSGNSIPGDEADNLCLRAYHLLKKDFKIAPVKIHLHKIIPMGAGLGGGSSDAACSLKMLNEIFSLDLSTEKLGEYAAQLGSDCAFFLYNKPMLGSGRGEILSPVNIDLRGKHLVIVKPEIHVSTATAYADVTPQMPPIAIQTIVENYNFHEWRGILNNDFELTVLKKYPAIAKEKNTMYKLGAVYAGMTGSGAAVFGIFDVPVDVREYENQVMWSGVL